VELDIASANVIDVYQLLTGIVTPRPIAWVTTLGPAQSRSSGRGPRAIVAAYDPVALDGWPEAAPAKADAEKAKAIVQILDELKAAAAVPGDGQKLINLWDQSSSRLMGVTEAGLYQDQADGWRLRIQAANTFRALVNIPGTLEQAMADAWKKVAQVGMHPSLTADD
jgi:hypothetical protein